MVLGAKGDFSCQSSLEGVWGDPWEVEDLTVSLSWQWLVWALVS